MFYYAILRNNEFVISTVKSAEKNAEAVVARQMMLWQNHYPDSNLRVIKLKKRSDAMAKAGWTEL